jgi:CheY-like chemotaxis protein
VLGDPLALQRVVSNLVANAVRHTQSGRVLLGARRRGERLRLQVMDTGPGIEKTAQARIFEEFYRLPSAGGHGFGLGLATVKRLCDAAGYTLGLESVPGCGSTFWVELPLADAPATPAGAPGGPMRAGAQAALKILLVEDDPAARDALATVLRNWGHACTCIATADDALAAVAGVPGWDAVVSDYDLPGGRNGLQTIAGVRAATRADLPALLISGTMGPALREAAAAAGCIALGKPVKPLQLRSVLGNITATRLAG